MKGITCPPGRALGVGFSEGGHRARRDGARLDGEGYLSCKGRFLGKPPGKEPGYQARLREESARRERIRCEIRPIRYLYECPICGKEYPRTRRYSKAVSCSSCDNKYNPQFSLRLRM